MDYWNTLALQTGMLEFLYILLCLIALLLVYYLLLALYNITLHPLSSYPGPPLAACTSLYFAFLLARGTAPQSLLHLHDRYGDVVRIAPNELTYVNPQIWRQIYARTPELVKDSRMHDAMGEVPAIITARTEHHRWLRKMLAQGFSDQALREQEPVMREYVDLLVRRLGEECGRGDGTVDLAAWFNYCTFDIIGYFTYGESFNCLSTATLHPWIAMIFDFIKINCYGQALRRLPRFMYTVIQKLAVPRDVLRRAEANREITREKVLRRLQHPSQFPDLLGKLISALENEELSFEELVSNAEILTIAGSETTATLLAGVAYHLLRNPSCYQTLVKEVRTAYLSADEITITSTARLKYLSACLEEGLRVHPPSPDEHMRITQPGGIELDGRFVPGGIAVGIPMYAVCNSERNFRDAKKFAPKRWLGDSAFVEDQRDAMQAFGIGPRSCVGQNLAHVEMRLILTKLLWSFDLELCDESAGWGDQKIYMVWDKCPLYVQLIPVRKVGG